MTLELFCKGINHFWFEKLLFGDFPILKMLSAPRLGKQQYACPKYLEMEVRDPHLIQVGLMACCPATIWLAFVQIQLLFAQTWQ